MAVNRTSSFQLINLADDADRKYFQTFLPKWNCEHVELKNKVFAFYADDAIIDGHLWLDFEAGWMTNNLAWRSSLNIAEDNSLQKNCRVSGLVVTGSLSLSGSVINKNGNYGPSLDVGGGIHAHNLIGGGAYITVIGAAKIDGVTFAHYNDGSLSIGEELDCPVIINEGHDLSFKSHRNNKVHIDGDSSDKKIISNTDDDGNTVIPKKLRKDLITDIVEWDDVLVHLCEGKNILLSQGAKSSLKNNAYWLERINRDCRNLAKVPEEEITAELCEIAVKQGGFALQYVPEKMKTLALCESALDISSRWTDYAGANLQYIPSKMITKELCYKAARAITCIKFIPKKILDYDLAYEVVKFNSDEIENIPKEYKKRMLLLLAGAKT
ncbi:hypothetical protein [Undibacterium sp. Xuan67W]|uniref:hypothetical protein n=1 Tax=Undibacterium sp. Xuan67W TaxID=3413057 RepID=UPI003BEFD9B2